MSDTKYIAGLYLRLSKDDERAGESVSIENQRLLLTNYVQEKGWEIRDTYIDDGWSGTTMQRPAFQRMMRDAEDKLINLIIVKDAYVKYATTNNCKYFVNRESDAQLCMEKSARFPMYTNYTGVIAACSILACSNLRCRE